jgi:integrase/recombinase XerD
LFLGRGGKGLSRMGIWLIVRKAAKKSGLEKRVHPHTFRHSFATHLLQAGADMRSVQAMLGHRSVSTTQIYAHLDRAHLADVHRRYHPLEAPRTGRRGDSD